MITPYKILYTETLNFLSNKAGANFVAKQLIADTSICPAEAKTLNDIYFKLIDATISTKSMKRKIGNFERLENILLKYDPIKIASKYGENWETLVVDIKNYLGSINESEKEMDANWPYWEALCKNALSGAMFLQQLGTVKTFRAFIQSFQSNEMTTSVLPMLLQKEVSGLTFPSACNFLAKTGFDHYVAPDPKVKALLYDVEIIESKDNYELLKALLSIGMVNGEKPRLVNKAFHVIASGQMNGVSPKENHLRSQFIDYIRPILNRFSQK